MHRRRVWRREGGAPVHGVVEVVDLARRLARRGMVQTGVVHVADHTLEPGQHASGRHGLVGIVTCGRVRRRWPKKESAASAGRRWGGSYLHWPLWKGWLVVRTHTSIRKRKSGQSNSTTSRTCRGRKRVTSFLSPEDPELQPRSDSQGKPRRPRVSGVSRAFALSTYGI